MCIYEIFEHNKSAFQARFRDHAAELATRAEFVEYPAGSRVTTGGAGRITPSAYVDSSWGLIAKRARAATNTRRLL